MLLVTKCHTAPLVTKCHKKTGLKLKALQSLKAPVLLPRSNKAPAELRLLYQSVY